MRKLYDYEVSGNCHKVRMLLALLKLDYERVNIDLWNKAQMHPDFLAINPLHKVPVLVDDDLVLRDSVAIMVYLAGQYDRRDLFPADARSMGEIQQWLSFSVNEVFHGLAISRAAVIFKRDQDLSGPHAIADNALQVLEGRLSRHDWLALDQFTLADLACYPYAALAHEGNLSLEAFPAVRRWFKRIEALPDYLGMRGLPYPH